MPKAKKCRNRILTDIDRAQIRELNRRGYSDKDIQAIFGINPRALKRAVNNDLKGRHKANLANDSSLLGAHFLDLVALRDLTELQQWVEENIERQDRGHSRGSKAPSIRRSRVVPVPDVDLESSDSSSEDDTAAAQLKQRPDLGALPLLPSVKKTTATVVHPSVPAKIGSRLAHDISPSIPATESQYNALNSVPGPTPSTLPASTKQESQMSDISSQLATIGEASSSSLAQASIAASRKTESHDSTEMDAPFCVFLATLPKPQVQYQQAFRLLGIKTLDDVRCLKQLSGRSQKDFFNELSRSGGLTYLDWLVFNEGMARLT